MALAALGQRHLQRALQRRRDRVGLVGIDDERVVELFRRAGELRQHEHAGIVRILRGEILLGDEIHAVAQRRHHGDVGRAIETRQNRARIGTVDVADRRPGRVAESAVDLADESRHLGFDLAVLLDVGTALRRDLQQRHLPAPLGIVLEQPLERLHAIRNALRIVESIDAEHETAAAEALPHQGHERRAPRVAREAHVRLGFDADREGAEPHFPALELVRAAANLRRRRESPGNERNCRGRSRSGSRRDCSRSRPPRISLWCGRVCRMSGGAQGVWRKNPIRVAVAARAQLASEQHQMIVVHPDDVVLVEQRAQAVGEHAIDAHVAAGVRARVFLQVDPVVKDGPQHAVGEAVVIFLDVVCRQIDENVSDLVDVDCLRLASAGSSATLPLQPNHIPLRFFSAAFTATAIPPANGVRGRSGTATRLETMMSRAPMRPPNSTTAASRY